MGKECNRFIGIGLEMKIRDFYLSQNHESNEEEEKNILIVFEKFIRQYINWN